MQIKVLQINKDPRYLLTLSTLLNAVIGYAYIILDFSVKTT